MKPLKPIPGWAKRERDSDFAWIRENQHLFWDAAQEQYKKLGRGAIVIDTTSQPLGIGTGNPFMYCPQEEIDQTDDKDVQRMLQEYDPETEIVVVLLKKHNKVSSYRLKQIYGE